MLDAFCWTRQAHLPEEFWKESAVKYPSLWKIAVNMLCVPARAAGMKEFGALQEPPLEVNKRLKGRRLDTEVILNCNRSFIPPF